MDRLLGWLDCWGDWTMIKLIEFMIICDALNGKRSKSGLTFRRAVSNQNFSMHKRSREPKVSRTYEYSQLSGLKTTLKTFDSKAERSSIKENSQW